MKAYLTESECGDRLPTSLNNRCEMCEQVERLASRHIAKLLTKLGNTIPPVVEQEIKRQFRFFSNDVISVIQGDTNDTDDSAGNR